jgi:hypothetical protein
MRNPEIIVRGVGENKEHRKAVMHVMVDQYYSYPLPQRPTTEQLGLSRSSLLDYRNRENRVKYASIIRSFCGLVIHPHNTSREDLSTYIVRQFSMGALRVFCDIEGKELVDGLIEVARWVDELMENWMAIPPRPTPWTGEELDLLAREVLRGEMANLECLRNSAGFSLRETTDWNNMNESTYRRCVEGKLNICMEDYLETTYFLASNLIQKDRAIYGLRKTEFLCGGPLGVVKALMDRYTMNY